MFGRGIPAFRKAHEHLSKTEVSVGGGSHSAAEVALFANRSVAEVLAWHPELGLKWTKKVLPQKFLRIWADVMGDVDRDVAIVYPSRVYGFVVVV